MTEAEAHAEARALAELLGSNWKPHVWESLGWHYRAQTLDANFTVYPCGDGTKKNRTYHALLNTGESCTGGGLALWTDDFYHADPREVVRHQAELALEKAQRLMDLARRADAVRVAMENEQ